MFDHLCTACDKRQLIFPSQVTSLVNTDHGIIVAFTCWCGAEQTAAHRPHRRAARRRLSALGDGPRVVCLTTRRTASEGTRPVLVSRPRCSVYFRGLPAGQRAALAQSVERLTRNEKVVGSIPTGGSTRCVTVA